MANIIVGALEQGLAQGVAQGVGDLLGDNAPDMRSWQHATRLFVDSNYRLSPKYSFLCHMALDLDPGLAALQKITSTDILEMGQLVKSFQLPRFSIDNKVMNAYNRVNVVQNKVKYDPLTITLHDDSDDVVREFWFSYFNYLYRDSDYQPAAYYQAYKYDQRFNQSWGFNPKGYGTPNSNNEKLIRSIRLYSLHQKQFTEYQLINPTIVSFQHGDHENGRNDLMQNSMTVVYESVLYSTGTISPDDNIDFAVLHYDNGPSPLATNNQGSVSSIVKQLGLNNAIANPAAFIQTAEANLGQLAKSTASQLSQGILSGSNQLSPVNIPSIGGLFGFGGAAPTPPATARPGVGQTGPLTPSGVGLASVQTSTVTVIPTPLEGYSSPPGGPGATSNGDALAASNPQPTMNDVSIASGDQGDIF